MIHLKKPLEIPEIKLRSTAKKDSYIQTLTDNRFRATRQDEPQLSTKTFRAGGKFGIEVSSVNNLETLRSVISLSKSYGFSVDRCDECRGIVRLPRNEIEEMVTTCAGEGIGLLLAISPRAIYDTGGFVRSVNGKRVGYRIRGTEGILHALDDIHRAVDLGVRGFIIYDEGLLMLLSDMRMAGQIPAEVIFKVSVHMGCANSLSARVYEKLGADTINPIPDLSIPMLADMRTAVDCPLDIFSDTSEDAGGFLRTHEVPKFVDVAAPVYIKCGPISQGHQNHLPSPTELAERIKQIACVLEMLARAGYANQNVGSGEATLGVPAIS